MRRAHLSTFAPGTAVAPGVLVAPGVVHAPGVEKLEGAQLGKEVLVAVPGSAPSPRSEAPSPRMFGWFSGRFAGGVAAALIGAAIAGGVYLAPGADPSISGPFGSCEAQHETMRRAAADPLGEDARRLATEALQPRPDKNHPFIVAKEEVRKRLERLGLLVQSGDHVHISDVDFEHGGAVLRSALGLNPLVTVTSTMSTGDVPEEFARYSLRPEQYVRLAPIFLDRARGPDTSAEAESAEEPPPPAFQDLIARAMVDFEYDILEKKMRLHLLREQREQLPASARLFVNMSFGTSRDRTAGELANMILTAPPDSPLYHLATRVLGEAPQLPPEEAGPEGEHNDCSGRSRLRPQLPNAKRGEEAPPPEVAKYLAQIEKLKRDLLYPELNRALASPEMKSIISAARRDFEREVAESRRAGILVFEAAGNEHSDALAAGNPAMSESTTAGTRGVLLVGAVDLAQPLDPRDDRVANFSAAGNISISAAGVNLPVWLEGGALTDSAGTSFASPVALEVAAALAAIAPNISVERIERFLKDKRVAIKIPGATRDGAGVLDAFAAVLVAASPQLTRAQIDDAWRALGDPRADIAAIRRTLKLPAIDPHQN